MTSDRFEALLKFIPILESDALKDAHSVYITTGEYPAPVRDLQEQLKATKLGSEDADWLSSVDLARPYLQEPDKILDADSATLDRLISIATYSEKFNKSLFPHLCSSGFMLALLKRMRASKLH
jgi:hypothetical protein